VTGLGEPKLFWASLAFALVVVLAVHFFEFPGSVPNFEDESGGGTLLDVKPSFSEEATYERLASYGESGRKNYAFRNRSVDIVLPLSVLPFLMLLALRAIRGAQIGGLPRGLLLAFPLMYVLFDLAENGLVLALLGSYPDRLSRVAAALPYLTLIKRAASLLAIAVPLVVLAFGKIRRARAFSGGR
jgi:hypothetical protein